MQIKRSKAGPAGSGCTLEVFAASIFKRPPAAGRRELS